MLGARGAETAGPVAQAIEDCKAVGSLASSRGQEATQAAMIHLKEAMHHCNVSLRQVFSSLDFHQRGALPFRSLAMLVKTIAPDFEEM